MARTDRRIASAASQGRSCPKMALPATKTLAPAVAASGAVVVSIPPSTSMSSASASASTAARACTTLGMTSAMKDWPPNPGNTVMHNRRSMSCRYGRTASNGVSGLRATPTRSPRSRIRTISSSVPPISTCTVHPSAPAAAKSSR